MSKSDKKAKKVEIQRAMGRLEDAVKELGDAAKGNFADRAADVLEEAAAKLKSEDSPRHSSVDEGRLSHWRAEGSERPFRDLDNGVIWGICAGIAPYLGLKIWVVRLLAVTGLIYAGGVILPAYIVAYFLLDPRSDLDELLLDRNREPSRRSTKRMKKRYARNQRSIERAEAKAESRAAKRAQRQSRREARGRSVDTAEAEPVLPARNVLRNVRGTLQEAEQRLRRMEGHVTSGRYELQKELRKIDTT